ncbi:YqjF family protein [Leptospira biflexa]|uniref:YqjF family protein n=1 Tax=Leptospira biflexa TaxID=172 RepID=UPI001082D4BF|nr:DUF2071 domain-containing protein [Leptospira biflexa]TGM31839.1 DUF2071 domain-containing protein [Leptospira biflexa]TGM36981.1 DUF2071 domain-containing protein [Leptospira biflexa]TGM56285.1 DUF2071 domain-containing protein [Leptospira biflexa]
MKEPIKAILDSVTHRPWPIPNHPWFWYQEWNEAIFFHYQVDPTKLRSLVPSHLELDQLNGEHWISVVAFTMDKVHPRFTFPIPILSTFHEVNLRTYVKKDGKSGVYFLNIEAEKWIPTLFARLASGLPYQHSKIQRTKNTYHLNGKRSRIELEFQVKDPIKHPNPKELWLTERYSLYRGHDTQEKAMDVHHKPWELFQVEFLKRNISYAAFDGLTDFLKPDLTHYSPGVQVLAWL